MERLGDFRVDDISSSASDVTIWANQRIVDAESDPQTTPDPISPFTPSTPTAGTDVRGVNITMFAGLAGSVGGIGTATNYLEIDVDVLDGAPLGVLRAFDFFAASTPGIFLSETDGDLQVHTVWTVNDVSLHTVDGSINDARNGGAGDAETDVLGQTIDLDANDFDATPNSNQGPNVAAHIGNPNGSNDLEIDSSRGAVEDVSLEADGSIFVTEADAKISYSLNTTDAPALVVYNSLETTPFSPLRLVIARAWNGNIRLTVREEIELPEDDDLFLLHSGDFQRSEGPVVSISNGTIIARLGYVLLRVGDDVDLHQNSQTLAALDIDIYGDAAAAALDAGERDPGYGTDMVLRGRIIAGCINPGDLTCGPDPTPTGTLGGHLRLTEIWGYDDIDHIQFGDPTGEPTSPIPRPRSGSRARKTETSGPGYVFIGSKTIARGGDDLEPGRRRRPTTRPSPTARTSSPSSTCSRPTCSAAGRPARVAPGGRPQPDARRPGRHRLLRHLHHRQPLLRPQLRHQRARHRRPRRRRRRARHPRP